VELEGGGVPRQSQLFLKP